MLRRSPRTRQAFGIAGLTRDSDVEGGTRASSPPRGECGAPELCGEHSFHPTLGARHKLMHDVRNCPRTLERPGNRFDRLSDVAQRLAQALQPLTLLRRQLNEQDIRVGCPISSRTARRALRRAASDQPLKRRVRVSACNAGPPRDGIAGGGAEFEQRPVNA